MSNISIRSEKSDSSQSGGGGPQQLQQTNKMEGVVYHNYHKAKLHELFALIEKEFDALYDENQELREKLAKLTGSTTVLPRDRERVGNLVKQTSSESLGSKSLGRLRFVKLQKNKLQKPKSGTKYLMLKDFKEHRDGIWEVSTCPWDVGYFATASADHSARVCTADGSRASVVYLAHMGSVNSVRFHPVEGNRLVCTTSGDKTCHIWKLPQASQMKQAGASTDARNKGDAGLKAPRPKPWTPILGSREDDFAEGGTPGSSPTLSSTFPGGIPQEHRDSTASRPASGQMPPFNPNSTNPISIPATGDKIIHPQDKLSHPHEASPTNELEENATIAESAGNIVVRTSVLEFKGHNGPVVAGSWTSSNSVASASWDNTVKVWSADNGRTVANLNSTHDKPHKITNVNTHPQSNIVIFSLTDGSFRSWDYRNNDKPDVVVAAHQGTCSTAIFTSDGMNIVTGGDDRWVKVWDLRNSKSPKTSIRCHSGVNRLAVSPITSSIVIPTDDKRSSIYDINAVRKGKFYHYEKCGHKSMVTSAAWSSDESVIFTAGFDRRVIAWANEP